MAVAAAKARRGAGRARLALRDRLEARREEIEAAALTRVRAIADPAEISDPAYAEGLRAAVEAAVSYGLEATGRAEHTPQIPVTLLAQARLAARNGVALDTVLRRYFAGYSLLGYYLMEEGSREGLIAAAELQRLISAQAGTFDRLLAAIGEEYARESEAMRASPRRSQQEKIERLLAGEHLDASEIPYDFDGWHLGMVGAGARAERSIRALAERLECGFLLVRREGDEVWAWLGARRPIEVAELLAAIESGAREEEAGATAIAIGEPAEGLAGWRFTHRQAFAALPVARRRQDPVVRYADVALLASLMKDELLRASLHELYIAPLGADQSSGETLRQTLSSYFLAGHNVSSAAARLGVRRHTVSRRIRIAEERIGRQIGECAPALEAALELHDLEDSNLGAFTYANRPHWSDEARTPVERLS